MSDTFEKVNAGDTLDIQAGTWNGLLEAGAAYARTKGGREGAPARGEPLNPSVRVLVRNDTGAAIPTGSVLKLGAPIIDAKDYPRENTHTPRFPGTEPATTADQFAVTIDPLEISELGRAVLMGIASTWVNIVNAADTYATPKVSVTSMMESASTGPARILWRETGTGTKRALVQITPVAPRVDSWKYPVRCCCDANVNLSTDLAAGNTQGGVILHAGERVLVPLQTTTSENGIYIVPSGGAASRATDCDGTGEFLGATCFVTEGSHANELWSCTGSADTYSAGVVYRWECMARLPCEAILDSESSGKWKWQAVTLDSSGNATTYGTVSATYNATPIKIDGTNLCNPVAGLRVTMYAAREQPGKFHFTPLGYAASGLPGLVSKDAQTISGAKTFERPAVINSTKFSNPVSGFTTSAFLTVYSGDYSLADPYDVFSTMISCVDTHGSGGLFTRRNYMFREAFEAVVVVSPPSPPVVPGELCVGGTVWVRTDDGGMFPALVLGAGNPNALNFYNDSIIKVTPGRCTAQTVGSDSIRFSQYMTVAPAVTGSVSPTIYKTVVYISGPDTIYEITGTYQTPTTKPTKIAASGFAINGNGSIYPTDGITSGILGCLFQGGLLITEPTNGLAMPQLANTTAGTGTLFYSTDNNKLCFKDLGGTVHDLY